MNRFLAVSALLLAASVQTAHARDTLLQIPLADVTFDCHAGGFVIGVALKGEYATIVE